MSVLARIAVEEWRVWLRSSVVLAAAVIVSMLLLATSALTVNRVIHEREHRLDQQVNAERTFLAQPDRHPHRMVHYGHYAFRSPPPLAVFDPGVDAITGQTIFLEGHRQNTAMFADTRAAPDLGGFAGLTPANLYQLVLPLLLIVIGHALFLRERESGTLPVLLAQGQSGNSLVMGKSAALLAVALIFTIPIMLIGVYALSLGESLLAAMAIVVVYLLYLCIWGLIVLLASVIFRQRAVALGALMFLWLFTALIVPRVAINASSALVDAPGKIESDLVMLAQQRELGDGHNAADPAFARLRSQVLDQYGVENVEELPINWRGVVASHSEAELTNLLNRFAEERMALESRQSRVFEAFAIASPMIAVAAASRALSGTDLATHHRFLREAEALRFDFVQGLNQAHTEKLAYDVDVNRNADSAAADRARISSDSWRVLDEFRFVADGPLTRLQRSTLPLIVLVSWLLVALGGLAYAANRVRV